MSSTRQLWHQRSKNAHAIHATPSILGTFQKLLLPFSMLLTHTASLVTLTTSCSRSMKRSIELESWFSSHSAAIWGISPASAIAFTMISSKGNQGRVRARSTCDSSGTTQSVFMSGWTSLRWCMTTSSRLMIAAFFSLNLCSSLRRWWCRTLRCDLASLWGAFSSRQARRSATWIPLTPWNRLEVRFVSIWSL